MRSILNLRHYHRNSRDFESAGFILLEQRLKAGELTVDDLVAALRQFHDAPKPVLVHCWHGSDRTGSIVAAYRIVYQNWTPAAALDELRHGGFGYHEKWFPNIVELFEKLDAADLRRRVLEKEGRSSTGPGMPASDYRADYPHSTPPPKPLGQSRTTGA